MPAKTSPNAASAGATLDFFEANRQEQLTSRAPLAIVPSAGTTVTPITRSRAVP